MALLVAGAIGASACSRRVTPPPPRPVGVPVDAVWAGGADGGAFIRCVAVGQERANTFECVVFGDRDGEVVGRGRFVTRPTFHVSLAELRRSYAAFDGSLILLANGVALAPDTTDVPFARPD
jgi:hypothetical protein